LTNSNGEVCCEVCAKPETKKVNSKLKDLVVSRAKTLLCSSCSNKAYKAQQKANVEKRYDGSQETLERFWEQNRLSLPEAKLIIWEERSEEVEILVARIKEHIAGSTWSQEHKEDFEAAIREFADEFMKHGLLETGVVLEWKERNESTLSTTSAESVYLNYGYQTAFPAYIAHSFLAFVEKFLNVQPTEPSLYSRIGGILRVLDGKPYQITSYLLKCATYGCKNTTTYENEPGKYRPAEWFCPECRAAIIARGSASFNKIADRRLAETQKDAAACAPIRTRDEWGRQIVSEDRIFGERGPYGK